MNKIEIISEPNIVFRLNNNLVDTHFVSTDRQLFECQGKSYIYKIDKQKLYQIPSDNYFKILLKIVNIESAIIENVDCISSRN